MLFLVITDTGSPESSCVDNAACLDDEGVWNTSEDLWSNGSEMIHVRTPLFEVGEVLIMPNERFLGKNTHFGRELVGLKRNPSKWDVKYEVFDSLDEAVKRAQEIQNGNIG